MPFTRRPSHPVSGSGIGPEYESSRNRHSSQQQHPHHHHHHINQDLFVTLGLLSPESKSRSMGGKKPVRVETNEGPDLHARQPISKGTKHSKTRPRFEPDNDPSIQHHLRPASQRSRSRSGLPFQDELGSMIEVTGPRSRRERTFVGSECAVCEEPLEHTLRGERILQLSCGHVAHEACFYEYIKEFQSQDCPTCDAPLAIDPSRGGNLNFSKLNTLVRSVQSPDPAEQPQEPTKIPTTIQPDPTRHDARSIVSVQTHSDRGSRVPSHPQPQPQISHARSQRSHKTSIDSRQHTRNDSGATGGGASLAAEFPEPQQMNGRRHDYDVQSMETTVAPRSLPRNPIPSPLVTVRSEFPTLSRSRQQQSLTCLVTVEVVDGKWRPDPEDIRSPPPIFPQEASDSASMPPRSPARPRPVELPMERPEILARVSEDLRTKVDNWHGLDFSRFGKLILYGTIRVGKDRQSWQDLECYLFSEMLICIKEKKVPHHHSRDGLPDAAKQKSKCTLKGSILIKRHLKQLEHVPELGILTLSLSVAELPHFNLQFNDMKQLDIWRRALINIDNLDLQDSDEDYYPEDDAVTTASRGDRRMSSSGHSSYGAARSNYTAPTEYTSSRARPLRALKISTSIHVPLDIVVVVPISSSMQGLKISLLRDVLRFLVSSLGDQDRMGLVTFGSNGGSMPIVGMTSKDWSGWPKVMETIRPIGQKSLRADVVDGANVAMDLLMQRKSSNPLSSILLISDSATSDTESVDFVVSRAEAAKIAVHSFGLGLTHKPDTMIELSTRTKATYTYVKDWMMLRECVAGCLGSLQSISHQNAKLKLRLPEGSPAKFVKISGALQITKRASGRDAEASLGDLRFGDKRDILVQLAITPDSSTPEQLPQDPWENMISGLEALGGPLDQDDMRALSVEEVPLIQADLLWGDILREGNVTQLPRPSLLAITMLPAVSRKASQVSLNRSFASPIPPHPSIVQRRMELLTSDMLSRALTLVSKGQHERACHLLTETRTILKGLGKGGLPPLPPPPSAKLPPTPALSGGERSPNLDSPRIASTRTPSPPRSDPMTPFTPAAGIDTATMTALDAELESSLEWINHPAVFGRDSRKAVLQAIGVISSQRAFTFRTPAERLWASRIPGTKKLSDSSYEWREAGDEMLMEESS